MGHLCVFVAKYLQKAVFLLKKLLHPYKQLSIFHQGRQATGRQRQGYENQSNALILTLGQPPRNTARYHHMYKSSKVTLQNPQRWTSIFKRKIRSSTTLVSQTKNKQHRNSTTDFNIKWQYNKKHLRPASTNSLCLRPSEGKTYFFFPFSKLGLCWSIEAMKSLPISSLQYQAKCCWKQQ